jgi:hypothetical protein
MPEFRANLKDRIAAAELAAGALARARDDAPERPANQGRFPPWHWVKFDPTGSEGSPEPARFDHDSLSTGADDYSATATIHALDAGSYVATALKIKVYARPGQADALCPVDVIRAVWNVRSQRFELAESSMAIGLYEITSTPAYSDIRREYSWSAMPVTYQNCEIDVDGHYTGPATESSSQTAYRYRRDDSADPVTLWMPTQWRAFQNDSSEFTQEAIPIPRHCFYPAQRVYAVDRGGNLEIVSPPLSIWRLKLTYATMGYSLMSAGDSATAEMDVVGGWPETIKVLVYTTGNFKCPLLVSGDDPVHVYAAYFGDGDRWEIISGTPYRGDQKWIDVTDATISHMTTAAAIPADPAVLYKFIFGDCGLCFDATGHFYGYWDATLTWHSPDGHPDPGFPP